MGWMLSNKEDKQMLIQFFRAIKQRVGNIIPQWFMTDDAEQYHNAWVEVFGESNTRKILCVWHVDRVWRKALIKYAYIINFGYCLLKQKNHNSG